MSKLPMKTRILQYAIEKNDEFTLEEIQRVIEQEYRGEKLCNPKAIKEYYESFIGVGFFKTTKMDFDEAGELVMTCKVTADAIARKKYFY